MSDMHQMTYQVRPYEAGYRRTMTPVTLLNYLQDAAYQHSVAGGFSAFHLFERGLTWVLSRYHVTVQRYPAIGESVHVRTWYPGPQKPFYLRDWEVLDDSGSAVAAATSSWLILEIKTAKPVDGGDILEGLEPRPVRAIDDPFDPLPELGDHQFESGYRVRPGDTDLNRHVNHVHYVQWALESVRHRAPEGSLPVEMEAGYRAQALLGDDVLARAGEKGTGVFYHKLVRSSDGVELTRLRTAWK